MSDWPHFTDAELACPHCGKQGINERFMWALEALRQRVDIPFVVTSAYRCREYDTQIGGKGNHPTGQAIDLHLVGDAASQAIAFARAYGFTGVGFKQHGPINGRFVHLDMVHDPHPSGEPVIWTYT